MKKLEFGDNLSFIILILIAILTTVVFSTLNGCSTFSKVVRGANDVSTAFCRLYASENINGVSPKDYCVIQQNLNPFINYLLDEQQTNTKCNEN